MNKEFALVAIVIGIFFNPSICFPEQKEIYGIHGKVKSLRSDKNEVTVTTEEITLTDRSEIKGQNKDVTINVTPDMKEYLKDKVGKRVDIPFKEPVMADPATESFKGDAKTIFSR